MNPLTRTQYFYQDHELQTAVTAGCASTLVRCHKTTVMQIPERSPPPPAEIPLQLRSHALVQPAAVMVASTPALTALSPQAAPSQRLPVIARWINRMGNWMSNLRFRQPRPPTAMRATTPSTLGLHLASRRYAQAQRGSNSNYMSTNNRDIRR